VDSGLLGFGDGRKLGRFGCLGLSKTQMGWFGYFVKVLNSGFS
jgi:hypothetical protein